MVASLIATACVPGARVEGVLSLSASDSLVRPPSAQYCGNEPAIEVNGRTRMLDTLNVEGIRRLRMLLSLLFPELRALLEIAHLVPLPFNPYMCANTKMNGPYLLQLMTD